MGRLGNNPPPSLKKILLQKIIGNIPHKKVYTTLVYLFGFTEKVAEIY